MHLIIGGLKSSNDEAPLGLVIPAFESGRRFESIYCTSYLGSLILASLAMADVLRGTRIGMEMGFVLTFGFLLWNIVRGPHRGPPIKREAEVLSGVTTELPTAGLGETSQRC